MDIVGIGDKGEIEPSVYDQHLELMEIALDVEKVTKALDKVRGASG